jgi:hypothetical protein
MKKILFILVGIIILGILVWFKLPLFKTGASFWDPMKRVPLKEYIEFQKGKNETCGVAGCF